MVSNVFMKLMLLTQLKPFALPWLNDIIADYLFAKVDEDLKSLNPLPRRFNAESYIFKDDKWRLHSTFNLPARTIHYPFNGSIQEDYFENGKRQRSCGLPTRILRDKLGLLINASYYTDDCGPHKSHEWCIYCSNFQGYFPSIIKASS
jgi:hypothetical protein